MYILCWLVCLNPFVKVSRQFLFKSQSLIGLSIFGLTILNFWIWKLSCHCKWASDPSFVLFLMFLCKRFMYKFLWISFFWPSLCWDCTTFFSQRSVDDDPQNRDIWKSFCDLIRKPGLPSDALKRICFLNYSQATSYIEIYNEHWS